MRKAFTTLSLSLLLFSGVFSIFIPLFSAQADFLPLPKKDQFDEALQENRIETATADATDFREILFGDKKGDGTDSEGIINKDNFRTAGRVVGAIAIVYLFALGIQFFFSGGKDENVTKYKKEFVNIALGLIIVSASFFIGSELLSATQSTIGIEGQDEETFKAFQGKYSELFQWVPQIFAGVSLVMITLAGFNMVLRGQEDDVVQREKTFLKSFLIGFFIFILGLAISQIMSFNSRLDGEKGINDTNQLEYSEIIQQGFEQGDAIKSSKEAIFEIVGMTSYLLTYLMVSTLIMLVIASLYFVTNFGNEEQTSKAKRLIIACIVALIVSFSAYTLFQLFFNA